MARGNPAKEAMSPSPKEPMRTIKDRVERRIRTTSNTDVIVDRSVLDPTTYRVDVQGRGPTVEEVLDLLMPALAGEFQPSVYIWGPKGVGKSTICVALVTAFHRAGGHGGDGLFTSTRAHGCQVPFFAYADVRTVSSEFGFYRELLTSLVGAETVPSNGVSTQTLRERLERTLQSGGTPMVVTDHLDDPLGASFADIDSWLGALGTDIGWIAVGRGSPETVPTDFVHTLELEPYRQHTLVEILSSRANAGLADGSIAYQQLHQLAEWAAGDAHDALVGLYEAATGADAADSNQIDETTTRHAIEGLPEETVSLHRLFALPEEHQEVVNTVIGLADSKRSSIKYTAEAIAEDPDVPFQPSTVLRILYELADAGLFRRCDEEATAATPGRPPSTLEPRFPTFTFQKLYQS